MMNIIEGPALVTQLMKNCITAEMVEDGILEDVNTFIPSYQFDQDLIEPCIGLFEHETTPVVDGTLSHKIELETPFEFICIVFDDEDIEQSEIKGKDLAGRVAASIARNFSRVTVDDKPVSVKAPIIEAMYPVGTVEIQDKGVEAVATSIRIKVNYYVDWMACMKTSQG